MHATVTRFAFVAVCGTVLLGAARPALAQTDTTNIPSPPAERLAALEPFFGTYEHSDNYWMGMGPFRGTLEVRPAVKGWYVEWIIDTRFGPIDRELRMLTTWDPRLGRYRVWRFETMPQSPPGAVEAEARFDGDEFIMEWKESRSPQGRRGTFRNRIRMEGPDDLVIVSEAEPEGGDVIQLGVWRNRRVSAATGGTGSARSRSPSPRPVALTHVTVIDVRDGARHPDRSVVIRGDRIAAVGRTGAVPIPDDARVVDARGRFLIPGLWDMHVHSAVAADRELPVYLALGVTGVRNMHTTVDTALELTESIKRRLAAGTLRGPRFVANGPIVDGPVPVWPGAVALGTPDAARAAVDSLAAGGADFIKVYARLPRDVYSSIAEEAKRTGIPFVGHVPTAVRVAEAAAAGQRSIEHADAMNFACSTVGDSIRSIFRTRPPSSFEEYVRLQSTLARTFDADRCAPTTRALRRNGTWFAPTMVLYSASANPDPVLADAEAMAVVPPETRRRWEANAREASGRRGEAEPLMPAVAAELVRALQRAGVPLLAGTDVGNPFLVPGYSLHEELELLVEAGLSPLEALRAATFEPARFLEATDSLGTIEPGRLADLVLLDADPLEDIRHTRRIRAVIAGGRYFDRTALDAMLEAASARAP